MNAGDRRRQLLEAALDLFSRKGFFGVTTKEIAATAGVTEAIIFRHFPSKQALYTAVLAAKSEECSSAEWFAEVRERMDRMDDAGVLRTLAARIIANYRIDGRVERMMWFAALEGHEVGLAHYRSLAQPVVDLLLTYIQSRQKEGAMKEFEPVLVIAAIAGIAQNYAIHTEFFEFRPVVIEDSKAVETFTNILMGGLVQKKRRIRK